MFGAYTAIFNGSMFNYPTNEKVAYWFTPPYLQTNPYSSSVYDTTVYMALCQNWQ